MNNPGYSALGGMYISRPQLPPIYGGGQRGRQYFQRMDYFNTQQR